MSATQAPLAYPPLTGSARVFGTLALSAAQVGNHQPCLFHQAVGLCKQRGATVGQAILRTAGTTLLRHPVRVGQCQQRPKPTRMIGIGHRLLGLASQIAAILPGQLPGPLYATLGATGALLAGQQRQATVQVRTGATQDVALAQ